MSEQTTIPNRPPPRIARYEPFAGSGLMTVYPTGLRDSADAKRATAARLLAEAFELEAMAREAELTHAG